MRVRLAEKQHMYDTKRTYTRDEGSATRPADARARNRSRSLAPRVTADS